MSKSPFSIAPSDLHPHVSAAIAYFRLFDAAALSFLIEATIQYARNPRAFRTTLNTPIMGLTAKGAEDPVGSLRTTVAQAYRWYWEDQEWKKAMRTKDFLPFCLIRFCPSCPPKWAGKRVVVRVDELRGYPLRHCSALKCEGSVEQGGKQLLREAELVSVKGQL